MGCGRSHRSERGKNPSADISGSPTSPLNPEHHPIPHPSLNPTTTRCYPNHPQHPHAPNPSTPQTLPGTPHVTKSNTLAWGEEEFLATLPERDFIAFFLFFFFTLKSVGTWSFGVLSPKSTSSPTNISMDIKIEKSLISLRSCQEREKEKRGRKIKQQQKKKKRKEKKVTELEYSPRKDKAAFKKMPGHRRSRDFPRKRARSWKESAGREAWGPPPCGRTLMMLGIWSFGVSSPKQASTPQKRRMEKTLEKSAMKALTWRQDGETGVGVNSN